MLNLACLCGDVALTIDAAPEYINECNCTLCRKSGARWGYFHPSQVTVAGETAGYRRADKADPTAELHHCRTCGVTTHFVLTENAVARFGNTMMGVNMGLAEEAALAGIELRFPDGHGWAGDGPFGYVRAARIIGEDARPD